MNIPETSIHHLIDNLTHGGRSFALYRLPWTDEPILVLQADGMPETAGTLAELNGKEGFVMAPFHASDRCPIIIIRPDKVARNWDKIAEALAGESAPEARAEEGAQTDWHTVSLAGTMPMNGENMPTEWSTKNKEEQGFVSEYIRKAVKKFGSRLTEKGPYTARAGQLVHLKTDFHFTLKETQHLGDILQELHPTPAVCGLPKDETYRFILDTEGYDRSYYSGIIGWLAPREETTLYVNLRCMHIGKDTATLYAGGGILPTSEVDSEWEETQQKMNTMRNIL